MTKAVPLLAGLLLILGFGVAEGVWTNRWQLSATLEQAAARLPEIPTTIGDWQGTDETLENRSVAIAELSGYVLRRYVHRTSGTAVTVLLVCGRPGPIAVHTPDVCYQSAGYGIVTAPQRRGLDVAGVGAAEFFVADMQRSGPTSDPLRIWWSWSTGDSWTATEKARFRFATTPVLYKLYVLRSVPKLEDSTAEDDPVPAFLQTFLPAVQPIVAPPS